MTSEREGATKDRWLLSARCDTRGISISSKPISPICDFQITRCFAAGTFNEGFDYRGGGRGIICLTSVILMRSSKTSDVYLERFHYDYADYDYRSHRSSIIGTLGRAR